MEDIIYERHVLLDMFRMARRALTTWEDERKDGKQVGCWTEEGLD